MYRYFPENYIWSGTVLIALEMGGRIDEIDKASCDLKELAKQGGDEGTAAFLEAWSKLAKRLIGEAEKDVAAGHKLSAAGRYARASHYLLCAERMQRMGYAPREAAYALGRETFEKSIELGGENCERVEIPYEGSAFPALFVKAEGVNGPAPAMVFCQGLDSIKEMVYRSGIAQELARRGISTLIIDQPGTGESLRLRGLHGRHDSEAWASCALDYLQTRADVIPSKIGMMGWSLGGYYAPRAAAMEPRFALCVAWGANSDWGELQRRRLANQGDRPVPHYWEHVQWVFGYEDMDSFMDFASKMTLKDVSPKIKVPYLITHGVHDTQIPMTFADVQYADATSSPKCDLRIFTEEEGGCIHVSGDNVIVASSFISDWISDRFAEQN